MAHTIQRYGWHPSNPDHRDLQADTAGLVVANEVDPRGSKPMPAIFNQLDLGSCTANAVGAALQYDLSIDRRLQGLGNAHRRSRLDLYYGERSLEGNLSNGDTGAMGRDGFKFAQQTGVLLEAIWTYDITTYQGPPPAGKRHKLTKPYVSVPQDDNSIRSVLSNQQTIAFGFTVYDSFEDPGVMDSGIVPMPLRNESTLGGHEILAVGYLAAYPNHVLCRNSWGTDIYQGLPGADVHGGGYLLFPLAYLTNPNLSGDLRTIVRAVV